MRILHAYTTVMADIIARWHKMRGKMYSYNWNMRIHKNSTSSHKFGFNNTKSLLILWRTLDKNINRLNIEYNDF